MKKHLWLAAFLGLLGHSSANAADIPVKAPVYKAPTAIVAPGWSGFYVSVIECFETDGGMNYRSDRLI